MANLAPRVVTWVFFLAITGCLAMQIGVPADRAAVSPSSIVELDDLSTVDVNPYVHFIKAHGRDPLEYVVSKFADCDIVILGEMHEVKENLELVSALMPPLYNVGVRTLCMEAIKYAHTRRANRVVTGAVYDDDAATDLFRHNGSVLWGFREYREILRAIWQLNNSLPRNAPKFRIVGLDNGWDRYHLECGSGKAQARALRLMQSRDLDMAAVIEREVLRPSGKALVLVGYAHSFTSFTTPSRSPMGYLLTRRYNERIFQICLHQPHLPVANDEGHRESVLPRFIEAVMQVDDLTEVGWDSQDSPFANLRDPNSVYFACRPDLVFADLAQGYIFLAPLTQLRRVSWIPGFINERNFLKANAIAFKRGWLNEPLNTPQELDAFLRQVFDSR